jgi:hypothetical protein
MSTNPGPNARFCPACLAYFTSLTLRLDGGGKASEFHAVNYVATCPACKVESPLREWLKWDAAKDAEKGCVA